MGLFDFFKNKKENSTSSFDLETLLCKSASEPAYRAEFYRKLLSEKLIVITQGSDIPKGNITMQKGEMVNIVSLEGGKIPVFTSMQRIFDKAIIKEEVPIVEMKGEDLFRLAVGATFLINPYSDYGKELLPDEIKKMLDGTILTSTHKQITVEKSTHIQIAQPAKYPTDIVNSLKVLFSNKSSVKAAYLGWVRNPELIDPPHYIFGLDVEGDMTSIVQEAGFTAQQFLKSDEYVDFVKIDPHDNGISAYFLKSTVPFYKK